MHMSPASNIGDLTFPSELHCSWHGLFPHVGFAASDVRTNFPCFTHSKLLSPCSLSHYRLPLWTAWGLFLLYSSVYVCECAKLGIVCVSNVSICAYMQVSHNVCVHISAFTSVCALTVWIFHAVRRKSAVLLHEGKLSFTELVTFFLVTW